MSQQLLDLIKAAGGGLVTLAVLVLAIMRSRESDAVVMLAEYRANREEDQKRLERLEDAHRRFRHAAVGHIRQLRLLFRQTNPGIPLPALPDELIDHIDDEEI